MWKMLRIMSESYRATSATSSTMLITKTSTTPTPTSYQNFHIKPPHTGLIHCTSCFNRRRPRCRPRPRLPHARVHHDPHASPTFFSASSTPAIKIRSSHLDFIILHCRLSDISLMDLSTFRINIHINLNNRRAFKPQVQEGLVVAEVVQGTAATHTGAQEV